MSAPTRSLPPRPSLEQQRTLARELLNEHEAGDRDAAARVRRHLPDKQRIVLADAQFVLAREYGFESWAALRAHIEGMREEGSDAVLPADAREELRRALVAADAHEVRRLAGRFPAARTLVDAPLFPFDTPPLVHFAGRGDRAMVDLLLELGADPNRRSDWWAGGFHALHSARGEVADRLIEAGAVPDACAAAHLDRPALLREILDADPERVHERGGDGQTPLHFARSREVVDLLLERGADIDARDRDHHSPPTAWMLDQKRGAGRYDIAAYLVERGAPVDMFLAAALGLTDRIRELLEADPSAAAVRTGEGEYGEKPPSSFHIYTWTLGQHLTPLQVAAQFEQEEAFQLLTAFAGPKARLLAACASGHGEAARAVLRERPGLVGELGPEEMRALPDAGWAGNVVAVELMLALGFDPAATGPDGGTVLHCAAWQGAVDCVAAAIRHDRVRALIEERDATHGSTPLGWCCHGSRHCGSARAEHAGVARILLEAGARPGPNLEDATEEVLAVIRAHGAFER